MGHCLALLQICGQDMFWGTGLDNRDLQWQTLFGWIALCFYLRPPCQVFVGFSSNVTYFVPWSSLFKLKSSTNISWCSWQPRRPSWRVSRYHDHEYKGVTLDFVCQVHDFSIAALLLERWVLLLHLFVFLGVFPSKTCLHLTNYQSFAMDILLSLCLRCLSRAANITDP